MEQVIINVLLNALHAMPEGGRLTIRTSSAQLNGVGAHVGRRMTDWLKPGDPVVVCEITDSGCGIPKNLLGRVFEPFYTTRPAGQGTGLGLSITRSIIAAHRGLIDIDSAVGRGTTVRITLPVAHA